MTLLPRLFLLSCCMLTGGLHAALAQTRTPADSSIWREVDLGEFDFRKDKNYCLRIYGYYRYTDEGTLQQSDREFRLYRVSEGICELDIRYNRNFDDGANIMVARNLVHPDRKGQFMDYYELKPYTFLEKARRQPKQFTIETSGDTTRVYTRQGLAGTAVRDTLRQELRIDYNALSPDTAYNINMVIFKAHLSHVNAHAVYRLGDTAVDYVPQGNLRHISFDGDAYMNFPAMKQLQKYHEFTELYVDSVVYLTRDEYQSDRKTSLEQRRQRLGYTDADIDRLKQKLGVPPLPPQQLARIEEQRDWDDEYEHWKATDQTMGKLIKTVETTR